MASHQVKKCLWGYKGSEDHDQTAHPQFGCDLHCPFTLEKGIYRQDSVNLALIKAHYENAYSNI